MEVILNKDMQPLGFKDEIVSVKGQNLSGESIDAISKYIKGASGTEVEIGVKKLGEFDTTQLTLVREKIKSPDIPYKGMVSDKTGYLIPVSYTHLTLPTN